VRQYFPAFPPERVHSVGHHLAHAASAAYTSGWDECLVVVSDAMGEVESLSVYHFSEGHFKKLREMPASDSIGILYSIVTLHLGFDFNSDEYKIMGLAPYGQAERFRQFFEKTVELRPDGLIRIPILRLNRSRDERENYLATRAYLDDHLIRRRAPDEEMTADCRQVAAALQECLDRVVLIFPFLLIRVVQVVLLFLERLRLRNLSGRWLLARGQQFLQRSTRFVCVLHQSVRENCPRVPDHAR